MVKEGGQGRNKRKRHRQTFFVTHRVSQLTFWMFRLKHKLRIAYMPMSILMHDWNIHIAQIVRSHQIFNRWFAVIRKIPFRDQPYHWEDRAILSCFCSLDSFKFKSKYPVHSYISFSKRNLFWLFLWHLNIKHTNHFHKGDGKRRLTPKYVPFITILSDKRNVK